MGWLLFVALAHARCAVDQEPLTHGLRVAVAALAEPIACTDVALRFRGDARSDWDEDRVRVRVRRVDRAGFRSRVPRAQVREEVDAWRVAVPDLAPGDRLEFEILGLRRPVASPAGTAPAPASSSPGARAPALDAPAVTVVLGAPPPRALAPWTETVREVLLDPRDPAWGFVQARKGRTRTRHAWSLGPAALSAAGRATMLASLSEAGALALDLPPRSQISASVSARAVAHGLRVDLAGAGAADAVWETPGPAPAGIDVLGPGTLEVHAPAVRWEVRPGPGVTLAPLADGWRAEAPRGGEVRWRVAAVGDVAVLSDVARWLEGLTYRFAGASLPEPAVPHALRGMEDRVTLLEALAAESGKLRLGRIPWADPLTPRNLLAVKRSGWATPVERALVLHRLLVQEGYDAAWALTGANADLATFTGFDRMLVRVRVPRAATRTDDAGARGTVSGEALRRGGPPPSQETEDRWYDLGCRPCEPGQFGTDILGRPAIGAFDRVPQGSGSLLRALQLQGDVWHVRYDLTGDAVRWLRDSLERAEPERREEKALSALGMREGTLVGALPGLDTAIVRIEAVSQRSPLDPLIPDRAWPEGWSDVPWE